MRDLEPINGEVVRPQRASYWNPKGVPAYRKPVVRMVCLLPIAGYLGNQFLQVRGYQSVTTSRVFLYSAAAILGYVMWTVAWGFPKWRKTAATLFIMIIGSGAVLVDRWTVPNKGSGKPLTIGGTITLVGSSEPTSPAPNLVASEQAQQNITKIQKNKPKSAALQPQPTAPTPSSAGGVGIIGAHETTDLKNVRVYGFNTGIDLRPSKRAQVKDTRVYKQALQNPQVVPPVALSPTYQQKCEGSACAQGPGAQATFQQFVATKPPPNIVDLGTQPLPAGPGLNPGRSVTFHVDAAFSNPKFTVFCDHPCLPDEIDINNTFGYTTSKSSNNPTTFTTNDPSIVKFGTGEINSVAPEITMTIKVRSRDSSPINSVRVKAGDL